AATDVFYLDNAVMPALGNSLGTLSASQFLRVTTDHGHADTTSAQRIIYNERDWTLWYDDDGNGAHAAVQLATLSAPPDLFARNFLSVEPRRSHSRAGRYDGP